MFKNSKRHTSLFENVTGDKNQIHLYLLSYKPKNSDWYIIIANAFCSTTHCLTLSCYFLLTEIFNPVLHLLQPVFSWALDRALDYSGQSQKEVTLWAPITDEMIQIQWYSIHSPSILVVEWVSISFLVTPWQVDKAWTTWNSFLSICSLPQHCFGRGCNMCITSLLTSTQENFHGMSLMKLPIKSCGALSKIT